MTKITDVDDDRSTDAGALFEAYGMLLQRFLRRRIRDRDEAADLVQDVFVRLVRAGDLGAIAHPKAFLFQTATNLLRDERRSRKLRHEDVQADALRALHPAGVPTPERVVEDRQRLRTFELALADLPPRCREVFVLARFDGLTYPQIAQRLGISISGVEKHMIKAIAHFSATLARES